MASNAIKGAGTKFEVKVGTGAYSQVLGFKGFSGLGGGSAAVIDVTDMQSTAKEKLMGLPDEGQASVTLHYLPKDAGQVILKNARASQAAVSCRFTLADTTKFEFSAFVLTFERSAEDVDASVPASCTLEITGAVTETVPV